MPALPGVRPAGERNTRPAHAERSGVGLAVGGIVQHGQDVVEQVFHAGVDLFEIALRGRRQVGAAFRAVPADSEAIVVTEPRGEPEGIPQLPNQVV